MGRKIKREQMLSKYTSIISKLPFVGENGEHISFEGHYICPLCLKSFEIKQNEDNIGDILTLEDVPPKSLGGTPCLLTCRTCNSQCGHKIDIFLLREVQYFDEKNDFAKPKKAILLKNDIKLNATFCSVNGENIIDINKNNDPRKIIDFKKSFSGKNGSSKFSVKVKKCDYQRNVHRAKVAALKTAYLLAFAKLGYHYILNENLDNIRQQILHPEQAVYADEYVVGENDYLPKNIPDDVYLAKINSRKCLAVIYTLKIKNSLHKHQIVIVLPCPEDTHCEIYSKELNGKSHSKSQLLILGVAKGVVHEEKKS